MRSGDEDKRSNRRGANGTQFDRAAQGAHSQHASMDAILHMPGADNRRAKFLSQEEVTRKKEEKKFWNTHLR